jgi:hypothetical protein
MQRFRDQYMPRLISMPSATATNVGTRTLARNNDRSKRHLRPTLTNQYVGIGVNASILITAEPGVRPTRQTAKSAKISSSCWHHIQYVPCEQKTTWFWRIPGRPQDA